MLNSIGLRKLTLIRNKNCKIIYANYLRSCSSKDDKRKNNNGFYNVSSCYYYNKNINVVRNDKNGFNNIGNVGILNNNKDNKRKILLLGNDNNESKRNFYSKKKDEKEEKEENIYLKNEYIDIEDDEGLSDIELMIDPEEVELEDQGIVSEIQKKRFKKKFEDEINRYSPFVMKKSKEKSEHEKKLDDQDKFLDSISNVLENKSEILTALYATELNHEEAFNRIVRYTHDDFFYDHDTDYRQVREAEYILKNLSKETTEIFETQKPNPSMTLTEFHEFNRNLLREASKRVKVRVNKERKERKKARALLKKYNQENNSQEQIEDDITSSDNITEHVDSLRSKVRTYDHDLIMDVYTKQLVAPLRTARFEVDETRKDFTSQREITTDYYEEDDYKEFMENRDISPDELEFFDPKQREEELYEKLFFPRVVLYNGMSDYANTAYNILFKDFPQIEPQIPYLIPNYKHKYSEYYERPSFSHNELLNVGRHTKIVPGGRIFSYSALVLVGNGSGSIGLGYGRGESLPDAVEKSKLNAVDNIVSVDLYEDRTFSHDIAYKLKQTKVYLRTQPADTGLICANRIYPFFSALGIKDLTCKIHGSRKTNKIFQCLFKAVQLHEHPRTTAKKRGRKITDFYHIERLYGQKKAF
eukprot:TRINITY_DN791_c3_g1_i2.p1 TRINITY_DN791_c3_g1~~TRINITY_DN791_c3_g1_i2.p1  ORF type:complete len:643 (+),score=202.22 TRINITY_DN791_c3_g1_i2:83-2011(+)